MVRVLAILLATTSIAWAADPDYCTAWSRGAVMTQIGTSTTVTYPQVQDLRTRAYQHCLLIEEGIDEADSVWIQDLVNGLKGTIPASGPVSKPPAPVTVSVKPSAAEVCARAHRRVVWHGKSWRCA